MRWLNILHAYQPANWDRHIINRVTQESYSPLVSFLWTHPQVRLTLNLAGTLVEQLESAGHHVVLRGLKGLVERGQVELMTMPKYHPLIPMLTLDDVERQVTNNNAVLRDAFGAAFRPSGLFPPELAITPLTGALVERLGLRWVLVDELACGGRFGNVIPTTHYHWQGADVRIVFRDRSVSDFLAFELSAATVQGFTGLMEHLGVRGDTVISAMDAENLGHHRPEAAPAWQALVTQADVSTLTVSEFLRFPGPVQSVTPVPTSWSTDDHDINNHVPYPLWQNPGNPVHVALHELVRRVRDALLVHVHTGGYTDVQERFDRAMASDVFWWASMRPMWDEAIILREAHEFVACLDPLGGAPVDVRAAWDHVQAIVRDYATTGQAMAARTQYLDDHRAARFFAGHHLT